MAHRHTARLRIRNGDTPNPAAVRGIPPVARPLHSGTEDSRAAERQRPSGRDLRAREHRLQARLAQQLTPPGPPSARAPDEPSAALGWSLDGTPLPVRRQPHRPAQSGRSVSRGYPRPGVTNTDVRLGSSMTDTERRLIRGCVMM